jgi:hypothetical protein
VVVQALCTRCYPSKYFHKDTIIKVSGIYLNLFSIDNGGQAYFRYINTCLNGCGPIFTSPLKG